MLASSPRIVDKQSDISVSINDTITNGTPNDILFVGAGPVISQDNNLTWDGTTLTANGAAAFGSGKFTVDANGKLTKVGNITLAGNGIAGIVAAVSLTNQGADITTTVLTGVAGVYRISYDFQDTTADLSAGAVTLTLAYTDGAGATTNTATQLLTGVGRAQATIVAQLASGNLTYAVSHTGIFGSAIYALYICVERII